MAKTMDVAGLERLNRASVFTTSQVAHLCGVAPQTAAMWIDRGLLVGRRIPGSRHRLVERADLDRFLARQGITTAQYELKLGDALGLRDPSSGRQMGVSST
jgi:excisionase family DNA binding protein